jgi:hypothetical protein
MARHIHIYDFEEAKHPRGKGGKFSKVAQKGVSATKTVTKVAGRELGHFARSFGKEDVELLEKHFKPGSETRKGAANHIKRIATAFPKWLMSQGREEKEKFIHAGKALAKIATGKKPNREEVHSLIKAGTTVGMVAMTIATHGASTILHHGVMVLAQEVAQEVATHTALEHAGTATVGVTRFVHQQVRGRGAPQEARAGGDAAFGLSPQEMKLMQDYLMKLAKNMEEMQLKKTQPKSR